MDAPRSRSSGNLLADRRYAYAEAALADGDAPAAADLARQVLELTPGFAAAQALLGRALVASGDRDRAVEAFREALMLEPEDALGVRIDLARLGALAPEEAIAGGYVRALFDEYAVRFDRHLLKGLEYRGPELLRTALLRALGPRSQDFQFRRVLDLGCGTGLVARSFEGLFDRIEGVDLSPRMLAQAARTGLYDGLHEADILAFLQGRDAGSADLIVAADVFVYMARLEPVLREAARVLDRRGLLAFTVQAHAGDGFALGEDARYAHSETYLRAAAEDAGLRPVILEPASTRKDRGVDVPGFVAVLSR
jgi:predicted TPR repeat methyltransferase